MMAYTKGVYELDAETGHSAIYLVDPADVGDRAPFLDPDANASRVLFHSAWEYLEVFYDQSLSLNLGAFTFGGTQVLHPIPDHNLGSIPFGAMIYGGDQIDGAMVVQPGANGWRTLEFVPTDMGGTIYERQFGTTTNSLPSITIEIRIRLLRTAPASMSDAPFDINPSAGVVQFGYGKFSTTGHPKLRMTTEVPDYRIPRLGRSIDSVGGSIRICRPDGTNDDMWGYSGAFQNPGSWGVVS